MPTITPKRVFSSTPSVVAVRTPKDTNTRAAVASNALLLQSMHASKSAPPPAYIAALDAGLDAAFGLLPSEPIRVKVTHEAKDGRRAGTHFLNTEAGGKHVIFGQDEPAGMEAGMEVDAGPSVVPPSPTPPPDYMSSAIAAAAGLRAEAAAERDLGKASAALKYQFWHAKTDRLQRKTRTRTLVPLK
ncbi:hypothetical protein TeGR_g882, partial [Tetraparma gracilis]